MTDAEKQIREAAAAEMRPGEWRVSKHHESRYTLIYDADGFEVARVCYPNRDANARLIAACNPAAIRELLAERDALKVENEKLLALERDMSNALPGHYYMDPPDGGDVPVLEQLRRMAKDAARYRFLSCKGVPPYFHRCSRWRLEYWNGEWWDPLMKEELDAAIDAQIEKERSDE